MEKFNFENENEYAHYVLEQANTLLDRCGIYGDADDRKGLMTNIEKSIQAKKKLENIFKNYPGYNGKGQIILPMEIEREIDANNIYEYADYVNDIGRKYLLKEAKINEYTYKEACQERESLYRYIRGVDYMSISDDDIIIKGKPFAEYREKYRFCDNICDKFEMGNFLYIGYDRYITREQNEIYEKVKILSQAIRNCIGKQLEDEQDIEKLANAFPHSQCRAGIKITRVVQKCLKEIGLYQLAIDGEKEMFNREYAKWCDSVSPAKVKKWSVISINFVDYLTMSCGHRWTSCLNVDKNGRFTNGMYSNGFNSKRTLDYALDSSTIVFYTVDENYDGNDWEMQPKQTRQLFHFGEGKLIQARLYPQGEVSRRNIYTQYREVMEKVLADAMGEANLWSSPQRGVINYHGDVMNTPYSYSHNGDYIDFASNACHGGGERDFQEEVNYVVFRGSTNQEDNGIPMTVGSKDAVCIMCGDSMSESYNESIVCSYCR